ncbi:MAG: hypothetical protein EXR66_04400 [Dehalococcoidia bacterium]|nr:hypothetical protein [Dehalococcoidia bacterium]
MVHDRAVFEAPALAQDALALQPGATDFHSATLAAAEARGLRVFFVDGGAWGLEPAKSPGPFLSVPPGALRLGQPLVLGDSVTVAGWGRDVVLAIASAIAEQHGDALDARIQADGRVTLELDLRAS